MDIFKLSIVFGVLNFVKSSKVYEWKSDWGSGLSTREFAQVHEADTTILHYAIDESALSKSAPAISLYDFRFSNSDFDKGILAVRPLISDGNQLCFIAKPINNWLKTIDDVIRRHETTVPAPASFKMFKLERSLPSNFDPLSIQSIADFCSVDSGHIFYMNPVNSVKDMHKLKIHGLFGRLTVVIPDDLINTVFGFFDAVL